MASLVRSHQWIDRESNILSDAWFADLRYEPDRARADELGAPAVRHGESVLRKT